LTSRSSTTCTPAYNVARERYNAETQTKNWGKMTTLHDLRGLHLDALMRRALELASLARSKGNHPFGALLCDLNGKIVLEAENTVGELNDVTCHAEQNLMSMASRKFTSEELGQLAMVTSTEPCAMCSGAAFWAGVRAIVFGLPEGELIGMCTSEEVPHPPVLNVPCHVVFESSPYHPTVVVGPVLLEEARVPHLGFWDNT
jgi:tRNA(Arg) A34 adenosine deaminase TadA